VTPPPPFSPIRDRYGQINFPTANRHDRSRAPGRKVLLPGIGLPHLPGAIHHRRRAPRSNRLNSAKKFEGRLDHLAFDSRSQRLFVAALENHTVEVVDLPKRRRVHQITGISEPQGLLCIPDKNRLLVCSRGDGTCRSFDATTLQEALGLI